METDIKKIVKSEEINSTIGENTDFKGDFKVEGSILIEGKFEGEISVGDHLIIGPTGKLKISTLSTNRITVAGTLIGNVKAADEVNLLETGRVLGDISTPQLHVSDGVVTEGQITITGGQQKEVHRIVHESFGSKLEEESKIEAAKSTNSESTEKE